MSWIWRSAWRTSCNAVVVACARLRLPPRSSSCQGELLLGEDVDERQDLLEVYRDVSGTRVSTQRIFLYEGKGSHHRTDQECDGDNVSSRTCAE